MNKLMFCIHTPVLNSHVQFVCVKKNHKKKHGTEFAARLQINTRTMAAGNKAPARYLPSAVMPTHPVTLLPAHH